MGFLVVLIVAGFVTIVVSALLFDGVMTERTRKRPNRPEITLFEAFFAADLEAHPATYSASSVLRGLLFYVPFAPIGLVGLGLLFVIIQVFGTKEE